MTRKRISLMARLDSDIHRELTKTAGALRISLNTAMNIMLGRALGVIGDAEAARLIQSNEQDGEDND